MNESATGVTDIETSEWTDGQGTKQKKVMPIWRVSNKQKGESLDQ